MSSSTLRYPPEPGRHTSFSSVIGHFFAGCISQTNEATSLPNSSLYAKKCCHRSQHYWNKTAHEYWKWPGRRIPETNIATQLFTGRTLSPLPGMTVWYSLPTWHGGTPLAAGSRGIWSFGRLQGPLHELSSSNSIFYMESVLLNWSINCQINGEHSSDDAITISTISVQIRHDDSYVYTSWGIFFSCLYKKI